EDMWYPPRLRSREWMFDGFDDRPPERHRGFRKPADLLAHVVRKIPKSCYYSTAYYRDPNERLMKDKGLQGADLIFDLDGDHLPGVTDGDFPAMMHVIQEQAHQLWSEFLEPEFGFNQEHLQVTFSGHRGFHLHYRSPEVWGLDSQARREIVSHIRGEGVDIQVLIDGPDCAWKRRITSGVDSVISKLDRASYDNHDGKSALKELKSIIDSRIGTPGCKVPSCGIKSLQIIAEKVQDKGRRSRLIEGFESGELKPVFGGKSGGSQYDNIFLELVKGDSSVVLGKAGETDEVVTIDLKRVIRWPTSLHGKSGLKVVEFPVERLDPSSPNAFDPLTESVPWKMGPKDVKVRAIQSDVRYRIGSDEGELDAGEIYDVDEATATFLILKKWAEPA
ncbi:MAG: DNA primase small subunit domain-containing protein, partial [Candidatus Thermoplasmatota archaeon]|nr:DNA primase small subunit domain-containing protein [Candidatus Thermoplasmatota archaeon]